MLIAFACLVIIGPWEVSTADLFDTIRNIPFGFKIGELHLSFRAVLAAVVVLAVLLIITRVVRRWLEIELSAPHHARAQPATIDRHHLRLCRRHRGDRRWR